MVITATRARRRNNRGVGWGFTLIETAAVVLLMGLLAGAATWSLADRYRSVSLDDVADQLRAMDGRARTLARRSGSAVAIEFEETWRGVSRVLEEAPDGETGEGRRGDEWGGATGPDYAPPRGVTIQLLADGEGETAEKPQVEITDRGWSRSYGWLVEGARERRWAFAMGMTGQWIEVDDADEAKAIAGELGLAGHDAR